MECIEISPSIHQWIKALFETLKEFLAIDNKFCIILMFIIFVNKYCFVKIISEIKSFKYLQFVI